LNAAELKRAMLVSRYWNEACSHPILWKWLYFRNGWTVSDEVMRDFLQKLQRLQDKLDYQFERGWANIRRGSWFVLRYISADFGHELDASSIELQRQYNLLFECLQRIVEGSTNPKNYVLLRKKFREIVREELSDDYYRAASFTLNPRGMVRVQVNWHYLYVNRVLLERNWRGGSYLATVVDGAPDMSSANQREGIYCVIFDHKYLAAGSRDNSIRLWNLTGLHYLGKMEAHHGSVLCLQLESTSNTLVSGSSDSTIKVWDIETRRVVQTLRGHVESVLGLHLQGKYIVSCSKDTTVRIWELRRKGFSFRANNSGDGEMYPKYVLVRILEGHRAAVNSVHVRDDLIATASGDRTVRLWNLLDGTSIRTINFHPRGIACVNITGRYVVTGSSDHVIRVFDKETAEEVRSLVGHRGLVRTIQTDETKIISGSYDQSIKIWDLHSGELLQELAHCHHSKYVSYSYINAYNRVFRVHRDQRRIISCCGNGRIVIWDFARSSLLGSVGNQDITDEIRVDAIFF
jgi:WD40 repeat protein